MCAFLSLGHGVDISDDDDDDSDDNDYNSDNDDNNDDGERKIRKMSQGVESRNAGKGWGMQHGSGQNAESRGGKIFSSHFLITRDNFPFTCI